MFDRLFRRKAARVFRFSDDLKSSSPINEFGDQNARSAFVLADHTLKAISDLAFSGNGIALQRSIGRDPSNAQILFVTSAIAAHLVFYKIKLNLPADVEEELLASSLSVVALSKHTSGRNIDKSKIDWAENLIKYFRTEILEDFSTPTPVENNPLIFFPYKSTSSLLKALLKTYLPDGTFTLNGFDELLIYEPLTKLGSRMTIELADGFKLLEYVP